MKNIKYLLGMASLPLIALAATPKEAAAWWWNPVDDVAEELNLTDKQEDKLEAIVDDIRDERDTFLSARSKTMEEVEKLLKQKSVSVADLNKLKQSRLKIYSDAFDRHSAALVEFHKMLTPDQRERLSEWVEDAYDDGRSFRRGPTWGGHPMWGGFPFGRRDDDDDRRGRRR